MTLREYFLNRRQAEYPAFVKVLRALPEDRLDYKPHERSSSAGQIAWGMTAGLKTCVEIATSGRSEWKDVPAPPLDEIVALFEGYHAELLQAVEKMDEAAWNGPGKLVYDGQVVMEEPAGEFLWFLLFDAIHHRGQLSAYLRPMGGKVPSIYGPSADDPGG